MNTSGVIDLSGEGSSITSESVSYQIDDQTNSASTLKSKESIFVQEYRGKTLIDKTVDQSKVSLNDEPQEF